MFAGHISLHVGQSLAKVRGGQSDRGGQLLRQVARVRDEALVADGVVAGRICRLLQPHPALGNSLAVELSIANCFGRTGRDDIRKLPLHMDEAKPRERPPLSNWVDANLLDDQGRLPARLHPRSVALPVVTVQFRVQGESFEPAELVLGDVAVGEVPDQCTAPRDALVVVEDVEAMPAIKDGAGLEHSKAFGRQHELRD